MGAFSSLYNSRSNLGTTFSMEREHLVNHLCPESSAGNVPSAIDTFTNHSMPGSRLGLHYFPDTLHYREADLQTWLPELRSVGASWLVLRSDLDRAIPEMFLCGLKKAGIEPVIQMPLSLDHLPDRKEVTMLLEVYARWGVRYMVFFERPNARSAWPPSSWLQQDLVERFLDRYLPVANLAVRNGLIPVFPPLEPGGSYWDTAFLRSALQAIQRRKQDEVLQNLVLSAYAWTNRRSLDWGAGGPERWPEARPYMTPTGSQDQRGFRIFDWYAAIARSVLHRDCPIMLFQAGIPGAPDSLREEDLRGEETPSACTSAARLLEGEAVADPMTPDNPLEPISAQVISCNFWLMSADSSSRFAPQAWFSQDGGRGKTADAFRSWWRERQAARGNRSAHGSDQAGQEVRSIRHYLLLPGYEWGVSDWYLEIIRPFVKKFRPTIGFSLEEAAHAARVTVVGSPQSYPENAIEYLTEAGCSVEQICGSGTDIASQLAER